MFFSCGVFVNFVSDLQHELDRVKKVQDLIVMAGAIPSGADIFPTGLTEIGFDFLALAVRNGRGGMCSVPISCQTAISSVLPTTARPLLVSASQQMLRCCRAAFR
jgi:hypothetical protein